MVYKCKMCGAAINLDENTGSVAECEYCGTAQTLPKPEDERVLNQINRANQLRQNGEFDRAIEIYERILDTVTDDSEIYWNLVLCKYGIEYVEDPFTHKRLATCHRTRFGSILEDADYLSALKFADELQKSVYKSEAEYIDKVQKSIFEISNKEEPFDVFICYKESDNNKRTPDSVLAQELYYGLTNEDFRVFFARITLERKLGTVYEPYIFAALNSAKVMVIIGTKPEYFNAPWVKNEWARFLDMMKDNKDKVIIPAYKDMDPYDLPDALSMFQAQDMSKLGFMQDLIRGIKKLVSAENSGIAKDKETVTVQTASRANYLGRAQVFLADGEFSKASEYFDKALDEDPQNGDAYLGKTLSDYKAVSLEKLVEIISAEDFWKNVVEINANETINNLSLSLDFERALRYSIGEQREKLLRFKETLNQIYWKMLKQEKAKEEKIEEEKRKKEEELRKIEEERKLIIQKTKEKNRQKYAAVIAENINNRGLYNGVISSHQIYIIGLTNKGKVKITGTENKNLHNVRVWQNIISLSAGENYVVGLKSDGAVVVQARYSLPKWACNVMDWRNIIALSVGEEHIVGLKADGTVVAFGENTYAKACKVKNWRNIIAVSAGNDFTVGLKSNGSIIFTEDYNGKVVTTVNSSWIYDGIWHDITAISAGNNYFVGLKSDGTVVASYNKIHDNYGAYEVSNWHDIIAISAGYNVTAGLKSDGTVVAAGRYADRGEIKIKDWCDIIAISAGFGSIAGLRSDGTVLISTSCNEKQAKYDFSDWYNIALSDEQIAVLKANRNKALGGSYGFSSDVKATEEGIKDEPKLAVTKRGFFSKFFGL